MRKLIRELMRKLIRERVVRVGSARPRRELSHASRLRVTM
jgi:hypothetical protein